MTKLLAGILLVCALSTPGAVRAQDDASEVDSGPEAGFSASPALPPVPVTLDPRLVPPETSAPHVVRPNAQVEKKGKNDIRMAVFMLAGAAVGGVAARAASRGAYEDEAQVTEDLCGLYLTGAGVVVGAFAGGLIDQTTRRGGAAVSALDGSVP